MVNARHPGILAAAVAMGAMSLAACSDSVGRAPAAAPSAVRSTQATSAPSPSPSAPADRDGDGIPDFSDDYPDDPKNTPQQMPITLTCDLNESYSDRDMFTVVGDQAGKPDFTTIWAAKPTSCDVSGAVSPLTDLEKSAYKTSGYDENDISTLYTICAEVDPTDAYAEAGFVASKEQIPEINAALTLCPKHPLAAKWRQAVQRGRADADLEAQGRLFGAGTFLVGKEIRPGTYVTLDVHDCYWERQNKSGETIDNGFYLSARRVQITIRSSDYAFHSEGCGEWRPVR